MKIVIELDDIPNFDAAVSKAVKEVREANRDPDAEIEPVRELVFVGLRVEIRDDFHRSNRFVYEFEGV